MDDIKALQIISALADGVNPVTGEVFADDGPYQAPQVVRALFAAARALEAKKTPRNRSQALPENAGKSWAEDEDLRLLAEFDRGRPAAELAQLHSRTVAGIEARLAKHGRIEVSRQRFASAGATRHVGSNIP